MKTQILSAALGLSALSLFGSAPAHARQLDVVATFSIIADYATQVGGDRVKVTTLVGPGSDVHVYEPRPRDAVAIGKADVVLANGLNFEGFLQRLIDTSASKARVATLTQGVQPLPNPEEAGHEDDHEHEHDHGHDHDHDHGHHHHGPYDPHAWQSVANAQVYVKNIADAFCTADPAGCSTYRANAQSYTQALQALDAELKADIARIPADRRTIITSHDAFGYYAHAYGFRFLAPQGISTDSEASAGDVAALVRQIKEQKAAALFTESISNPRLIQQIANETGIRQGGQLYADSLSSPGGPASNYIEMMRYNTRTIRAAILGE